MTGPTDWTTPPQDLNLPPSEIHLWRATLDVVPAMVRQFAETLALDEQSRATRFIFEKDRNHFVAARGILRQLLGIYLRCPPETVGFNYGEAGKPALRSNSPRIPIHFNVSHSYGVAVFAFGNGRELGVDVQKILPDFATEDIAQRYFSPRELEELRSLPPSLRSEGFFNCWTRKEAYVKACGEGLRIPLASFDVNLAPGIHAAFLRGVNPIWQIVAFAAAKSFPAALVYDGSLCGLRFLTMHPHAEAGATQMFPNDFV